MSQHGHHEVSKPDKQKEQNTSQGDFNPLKEGPSRRDPSSQRRDATRKLPLRSVFNTTLLGQRDKINEISQTDVAQSSQQSGSRQRPRINDITRNFPQFSDQSHIDNSQPSHSEEVQEQPKSKQQQLNELSTTLSTGSAHKAAEQLAQWQKPTEDMFSKVESTTGKLPEGLVQVNVSYKNESSRNGIKTFVIPDTDYQKIMKILSTEDPTRHFDPEGSLSGKDTIIKTANSALDYRRELIEKKQQRQAFENKLEANFTSLLSYLKGLEKDGQSPADGIHQYQEIQGEFGPYMEITVANKDASIKENLSLSIQGYKAVNEYVGSVHLKQGDLDNTTKYNKGW